MYSGKLVGYKIVFVFVVSRKSRIYMQKIVNLEIHAFFNEKQLLHGISLKKVHF